MEFVGFKYSKGIWDEEKDNKTLKAIQELNGALSLTQQYAAIGGIWRELVEDAVVYLKYNDHRERGTHDAFAFGVDRLANLFESLGSFERAFSPILTRSRDHLVHVIRTYLLGVRLLTDVGFGNIDCGDSALAGIPIVFRKHDNGKGKGDKATLGYEKYQFLISEEEKEAMWCIIALCHDLGLVLENVYHINREVRQVFGQFGRFSVREFEYIASPMFQGICEDVLRIVSSDITGPIKPLPVKPTDDQAKEAAFSVHIQPKYRRKFMVALDDFDHGVLSCVVLMKNLIYFLESDDQMDQVKPLGSEDARQFLIRKNILRAIASHNCESIYHISFMNFPFLLTLLDEMQEWGRPRPYMFLSESVLSASLKVNAFSDGKVDFEIEFDGTKDTTYHREIYEYAMRKWEKFKKILRCAVAVEPRIDLKFTTTDCTEGKIWRYELHHRSPRPSEITEQYPDDKEWQACRDKWLQK